MAETALATRLPAAVGRRLTVGLPANRPESLQVLFDEIVGAVRLQGHVRSEGKAEACMYYGDNGARCHVGLLIPPADYRPEFEGCTVRQLHEKGQFFAGLPEPEVSLLESFQAIHDDEFPEDWEEAFEVLADQLGLHYRRP